MTNMLLCRTALSESQPFLSVIRPGFAFVPMPQMDTTMQSGSKVPTSPRETGWLTFPSGHNEMPPAISMIPGTQFPDTVGGLCHSSQ